MDPPPAAGFPSVSVVPPVDRRTDVWHDKAGQSFRLRVLSAVRRAVRPPDRDGSRTLDHASENEQAHRGFVILIQRILCSIDFSDLSQTSVRLA